jgi:hypothetical protein
MQDGAHVDAKTLIRNIYLANKADMNDAKGYLFNSYFIFSNP